MKDGIFKKEAKFMVGLYLLIPAIAIIAAIVIPFLKKSFIDNNTFVSITNDKSSIKNPIKVPSFDVNVTLSPTASKHLKNTKETIIISTELFGMPTKKHEDMASSEGRINLGYERTEINSSGTYKLSNLIIDGDYLPWIKSSDYYLNINVSSGRRSSEYNMLNCNFFEDHIGIAVKNEIQIKCKLLTE